MDSGKQDNTTVLQPVRPGDAEETTVLLHDAGGLRSKIPGAHRRISLLAGIVFAATAVALCSAVFGFVIYPRHHRNMLTTALRESLHQNNLDSARALLEHIRRHAYTSGSITLLQQQVAALQQQRDAWDQVRQFCTRGMYREALAALAPFTADTVYSAQAHLLLDDIRAKELNALIDSVKLLSARGQTQEAVIAAHQVLEKDPSNQYARSLIAMMKPAQPLHQQGIPRAAVRQQQDADGDAAYRRGDFAAAVQRWSKDRSQADAKKIVLSSNIRKYIRIGKKALDAEDFAGALKAFGKARTFAGLLGIHGSVDENTCRAYLSQSYGMLGKQALSRGSYQHAALFFQKSLKYDPSNAGALKGAAVVGEEAERLYKTAYMMSGANLPEACRLYRRALGMSQNNEDVSTKIRERASLCKP